MKKEHILLAALGALVAGFFLLSPASEEAGLTTKSNLSAANGTFSGNVAVTGTLKNKEAVTSVAAVSTTTTLTLTAANSGTTYYISASGTPIILPAVTNSGANYRFVIGGAVDTGNVIVSSAEGDNIEGTLIVAGAVVDCRGEDFVNFIADGEAVGDYVEVRSNGTKWFIGDSGVLTTAKMTCTDPS